MKKLFIIVFVAVLSFSLCACESSDIKEARECIDGIVEYSYKFERSKNALPDDWTIEDDWDTYIDNIYSEAILEAKIAVLENIYENLSEKGQEIVYDYVEEVGIQDIVTIER